MIRTAIDLQIINERGTTVAGMDYARFGHQFGNIDPVFLYHTLDSRGGEVALKRLSAQFPVEKYESTAGRNDIVRREKLDIYYNILFRENFERVPGAYNAVHAVFDFENSVGDVFAYVSEWLTDHSTGGAFPHVPHIVTMPSISDSMKLELGIPEEAVVIGRYGAFESFDLEFPKGVIAEILNIRPDIYFIFANTRPFIDHPRVIHLPIIDAAELKASFINTCDAMLHAGSMGESFGLAIAEFLAMGCPVICWAGGWFKNHLRLQTDPKLRYKTARDLFEILKSIDRTPSSRAPFPVTLQFSPEAVSRKWHEVFADSANTKLPSPRITRWMQFRRRLLRRRYMIEDAAYNSLSNFQLKSYARK